MFKSLLRLVLILSLIIFLFTSSPVLAQELPSLIVDKQDNPLVIKGTLDEETTSFSGNVRLTLTDGEVNDLQILPSDLTNIDDASIKIDRSQINIPTGTSLSKGQPRDVRVTVNNLTHPGQYQGNVQFIFSGQTDVQPLEIPLQLDIDAQPNITPISDNLNFQVVRCHNPLSCGLATLLLPDSVTQNQWTVQLNNETLIPVKITDATVVMQGEKTNNSVNSNQVCLTVFNQHSNSNDNPCTKKMLPFNLEAQKVEPIDLVINRNQLNSDRYQGTLRFKLENADELVKVNATIAVRDAPIWALIVIILGILVGRLAQDMESPKAQKQVNLMPRYYELDDLAKNKTSIKNETALEFLHQKFETIKNKINQGEETEEVIKQKLDQLEVSIHFFNDIEALETQLSNLSYDSLKSELTPKINNARNLLIVDKIEQAQEQIQEIERRLALSDDTMSDDEDDEDDIIQSLRNRLRETSNKLIDAFQALPKPRFAGGSRWNWLAKLLATLSGIQTLNAEVRYWLIRPLLWLVLLILLVLLGLQTLYVNAGATFGVNGLYDYLGLFLWGLSADIANQGLRRLQSSNDQKEENKIT